MSSSEPDRSPGTGISARRGLLLAFTALVVAVSGLAWGLARLQSRTIVAEASRRISENAQTATEDLIRDIFDPIEARLLADAERISRSGLPRHDPVVWIDRVLPDFARLDHSDSTLIADDEGCQFLLMRYGATALASPQFDGVRDRLPAPSAERPLYFTRDVRPAEWGRRVVWTLLEADGRTAVLTWEGELPGYDPAERPWYRAAMASVAAPESAAAPLRPGRVSWTEVYPLFTTRTPGLSASLATRTPDGRWVVIAYDVLMEALTSYTGATRPSPSGVVFVVDHGGRALALPADPAFEDPRDRREAYFRPAEELGVPLATDAMTAWRGRPAESDLASVRLDGLDGPLWASFRRVHLAGREPLWIAVAVPEADLAASVRAIEELILAIGAVGLLFAALLAQVMARRFAAPLQEIAQRSGRIAAGDLDEAPPVRSRIREVRQLSHAIESMRNALASDRDERERLETELRRSETMAAIGRLAGGIAHDFNNLLTIILGYGDELRRRLAPDSPEARDVGAMLEASSRAAGTTEQLLSLSDRRITEARYLDLSQELPKVAHLAHRLLGEDIELSVDVPAGLPAVHMDPGELQQLLVNLFANARDAMPGGGRLALAARTEPGDPAAREAAPAVLLTLSDSGGGIAPEDRERIFEPFFTTKARGKGTGLGLAVCRAIVHRAGGRIELADSEEGGTDVRVRLPGCTDLPPVRADEPAEAGAEPGGRRVLIAEDEAGLRTIAGRTLRRAGFDVEVAADGVEALAILERGDAPIDLLVTDVVMPRMGGGDLAARLRERQPDLPVLFVSGYADHSEVQRLVAAGASFLAKPFRPAELVAAVRRALDPPAPPAGP